jgi:hypothetical protein
MFASPCNADDAEIALGILSDAIKCPLGVTGSEGQAGRYTSVSSFLGSNQVFRIDERYSNNEGSHWSIRMEANFADLDAENIHMDHVFAETENMRLHVYCSKEKKCSLWTRTQQGRKSSQLHPFVSITFCDRETLDYARLALETLIKLRKKETKPSVPEKQTPEPKRPPEEIDL